MVKYMANIIEKINIGNIKIVSPLSEVGSDYIPDFFDINGELEMLFGLTDKEVQYIKDRVDTYIKVKYLQFRDNKLKINKVFTGKIRRITESLGLWDRFYTDKDLKKRELLGVQTTFKVKSYLIKFENIQHMGL